MPHSRLEWIVFVAGMAAAAAMVALSTLERLEPGSRAQLASSPPHSAAETTTPEPTPLQARSGRGPVVARRVPAVPKPAASPAPREKSAMARVVITAARGESWLSAREDSAVGRLLYEGTLTKGRELRLAAQRVWLRLGAASNLDLTLNGRPLPRAVTGTIDVVVTPAGLKRA